MSEIININPAEVGIPTSKVFVHTEASRNHPDRNEDTVIVGKDNQFFIVCDGMGQDDLGPADVASRTAASAISESLEAIPQSANVETVVGSMREGFGNARSAIRKIFSGYPTKKRDFQDMATTACAVFECIDTDGKKKLVVGNVGDSRAYLYRNGELRQITLDQTIMDDIVEDPEDRRLLQEIFNNAEREEDIPTEIVDLYPYFKSVYTTCVLNGAKRTEYKLDIFVEEVREGDIIIVCSDGRSDCWTTNQVQTALGEADEINQKGNKLIQIAQQKSEGDFLFKNDDRTLALKEIK